MDLELPETVVNNGRMPAHNERFGATAAGSADLKGSAGKPPLRQAAIPLCVMRRECCRKSNGTENGVQSDNVVETDKVTDLKIEYSPIK